MQEIFFELLQVAVGNRQSLSHAPSPEEWEEIYDMVKKQTLAGVCFYAVKRLPENQMPPVRRIRQWTLKTAKTEETNKRVSQECRMVCSAFRKAGFEAIILKGQGNLAYYPNHLRQLRSSGDIDVWVKPVNAATGEVSSDSPIRRVIEFCQKMKKGGFVYYHNLDFPVLRHTPVEVHYRPTWLFCPWRDRLLQRWMAERFRGVDYDGYMIPTVEFNVVFQLLHIYKHLFEEGIGLRQLLDYYFCLVNARDINRSEIRTLFSRLGIMDFCGAVMYVLREVFALKEEDMVCPVDEARGRQLLSEIMIAGNFGHHDERFDFQEATSGSMQFRGMSYAWMRLRRNLLFLRNYPLEVIFEPPFRFFHWAWRTFRLWRF